MKVSPALVASLISSSKSCPSLPAAPTLGAKWQVGFHSIHTRARTTVVSWTNSHFGHRQVGEHKVKVLVAELFYQAQCFYSIRCSSDLSLFPSHKYWGINSHQYAPAANGRWVTPAPRLSYLVVKRVEKGAQDFGRRQVVLHEQNTNVPIQCRIHFVVPFAFHLSLSWHGLDSIGPDRTAHPISTPPPQQQDKAVLFL